jgi:hypothetical protein
MRELNWAILLMRLGLGSASAQAISALATAVLLFSMAGTSSLAAQSAPGADVLTPYASCRFSDGLSIVRTDPLPSEIAFRNVETDSGQRQIDMQAGLRIMFAYPDSDFYANVKAELLPAGNYPKLKQYLLDNFQHLSHGNIVNTTLRSPLNGFEIHGLDREKLEGGVLGIYLFFDEQAHVVTTIYLLNQEPQSRKFQSLEEYRSLRDRFLSSFTTCIRDNQHGKH